MYSFKAGYVSRIRFVRTDDKVDFLAQCQPEMKYSADYQIGFVVPSTRHVGITVAIAEKVVFSECSCAAGKCPLATGKHIPAVLFGIEEFSQLGFSRQTVSDLY